MQWTIATNEALSGYKTRFMNGMWLMFNMAHNVQVWKKVFSSLAFLAVISQISAKQLHLEFTNDQSYPQLVTITDTDHRIILGKALEVSATVTVYEELDEGTNVI